MNNKSNSNNHNPLPGQLALWHGCHGNDLSGQQDLFDCDLGPVEQNRAMTTDNMLAELRSGRMESTPQQDGITLDDLMASVLEWRFQDGTWFGLNGYDTLVTVESKGTATKE